MYQVIDSVTADKFTINLHADGVVWFPPDWFGDRTTDEMPSRVALMQKYVGHDHQIVVRTIREWEAMKSLINSAVTA
jgi:hypothetical protein